MEPERRQDGEGFGNRDGGLDMGIDVVGSIVNVLDRIIPCVRVAVVVDVIVVTEAGVDAFGGEVAVVGVVVSGFEVGGDDEVVPVVKWSQLFTESVRMPFHDLLSVSAT